MPADPSDSCPGSRGPAVDAGDSDTGTCPVCGRTFRLGYALLLPAHPPGPARTPTTRLAVHSDPQRLQGPD